MKKLALVLSIGIIFAVAQTVSAQTKKLLVFKKGVAVASGTVKGTETKVYYFKIKKDTDMEITLDDINSKPKFILFKPNGKPFYADGEVNSGDATDMMDVLPEAGIYKIVVKIPDNLQSETQPITFTLRLILK